MKNISYLCKLKLQQKTLVMKKRAIMIMLAMLPAMAAWAQDTITQPIRGEYFYKTYPNFRDMDAEPSLVNATGSMGCGMKAKELITDKPLTVYGLAAVLLTHIDRYVPMDIGNREELLEQFCQVFKDTSFNESWEYIFLSLRDGDSLEMQRSVRVHRKYDPPAYYVASGKPVYLFTNFVYPMYEKYFDSAISVIDTFYVGVTQRSAVCNERDWRYEYMWLALMSYKGHDVINLNEYHVWKWCYPERVGWEWPLRVQGISDEYYMIFPILTPPPTNPEDPEDPDPEGVTENDMVARYVTVQPNPATNEARVLSSFGLTRIEAFDAGGRQVMAREASGVEATLDVTAWPRGTYLLRIATPLGTATKKLLVQ